MIKFTDLSKDKPYKVFKSLYEKASDKKQKSIEAFSISTFNQDTNVVDSRFVNLKYIRNDEWIFFTNYNSEKAQAFASHPQVSILFFWNSISTQIRIKAKIFKTSKKISDEHFAIRTEEKNALAISSRQSVLWVVELWQTARNLPGIDAGQVLVPLLDQIRAFLGQF